jgi:4-hydroxybenzoate polyprenyltransferase
VGFGTIGRKKIVQSLMLNAQSPSSSEDLNFEHRTLNLRKPPNYFRTLLVLGRASNLPTVWSNCFAGWLLGGGGDPIHFFWLCIGATFLYTGGMFLNDAFDADFDRQHRRQRPIPTGAISEKEVWWCGFLLLIFGTAILLWMGPVTAILTLLLVACILVYDAIHKVFALSPVLMACCRLLLYLVAASVAINGVTGLAVWSAIALASYIVGLSYLARKETSRGALRNWPSYFLAVPILLALLVNDGPYQRTAFVISFVVSVWILWCLRHTFWTPQRNIGFTVSRLIAGIALVDWLAIASGTPSVAIVFVALFLAALLFQRFIPAT